MRLEVDLPPARVGNLAAAAETTAPRWPFDRKPEFIPGSCVLFYYRGRPIASATAGVLQVPWGARDPWFVTLEDLELRLAEASG